jgi:lipopolysaccharide export system permease protein
MRILDRYVLSQFMQALGIGILAFLLIYIVVDFFEQIGDYIDKDTSAWTITRLYLYKLPYISTLILPIAMLLASLFSLGRLSRDYELSAMFSAGLPLPRILMPLFITGALVSVGSYYFSDQVVTRSNISLEELETHEVNKQPKARQDVRRYVHKVGGDGTIYWAESYYVNQQRFENLVLLRYDGSRLRDYIIARHAIWGGQAWRLVEGVRHMLPQGPGKIRTESGSFKFDNLELPQINEPPESFSSEEKKPEAMDYRELRRYILTQSNAGEDIDRLWVDLHVKASFPWANFVIILLGGALSASKRRISMAAGFGLTVAIAFVYLIFLRLGLSLGHNHTLPPLLAAWVANIVFFVVGLGLLARASR